MNLIEPDSNLAGNSGPEKDGSETTSQSSAEARQEFRFAYRYVVLDALLRWLVLGLMQFGLIGNTIFWIAQAIVIPLLIISLAASRVAKVQTLHDIKKSENVVPRTTTWTVIATLFFLATGTYVSYSLYHWSRWLRVIFAVVTFCVYGLYLFVVYVESVRLEPVGQKPSPSDEQETPSDGEWREENDRVIIELETDRTSLSQRVEAYTLESALFGALSFSAFVTIVASDKPVLDGVQRLIHGGLGVINMIVRFDFGSVNQLFADMTLEQSLLAAIAIQTLVSSMCFLSVIISRLRFNDVVRRVDYSTRLASAYNLKEEEIVTLLLQDSSEGTRNLQQQRLDELKPKISMATYDASELMGHLVPIVMYMSIFRNLGVISFLMILIVSALWVSRFLAVVFICLSVLAYVYPFLDRWIRDRKLSGIAFIRKGKRFFPHLVRK